MAMESFLFYPVFMAEAVWFSQVIGWSWAMNHQPAKIRVPPSAFLLSFTQRCGDPFQMVAFYYFK
jgi:hypothetical protein